MRLRSVILTVGIVSGIAVACGDTEPPEGDHERDHDHGASGGSGATAGSAGGAGGSGATGSPASGGKGAGLSGSGTGGSGSALGGSSSRGGSPAGGEPSDGGSGSDDGGSGGDDGGDPPEPPVVNGCELYDDRTLDSAERTLAWDVGITDAVERCIQVRVGQSVTFAGDFEEHPLEINPFAPGSLGSAGDTYTFSFNQPGAFGYVCLTHSEMNGAIWVTP